MSKIAKFACLPVLALMLVTALAPIAAAANALQVTGYTVLQNTVTVSVANSCELTRTGVVSVSVVVNGAQVVASKSVQVSGKSASTTAFAFSGVVGEVIAVGIIEDFNPLG